MTFRYILFEIKKKKKSLLLSCKIEFKFSFFLDILVLDVFAIQKFSKKDYFLQRDWG